ncbi:hypothetical protein LTR78_000623 [Recurvomyces mirabilis]|uniref:Antitoxin n=1 Tax=Recurvomyces mirabilis TaxID=574656 RepID=A0AAE0WYK9_9PEZI|nr:hypothetical protein LTR78_000623 [Recurvomyces mirabilis]KAK5162277.1 hypothetical protein LTS14_000624 [Recurvomyces mirabilis]
MSGLMDKVKDAGQGMLDKKSQPGDGVERKADDGANSKIDDVANQAGVPQGDDQQIDKVADAKVNSDIPFGNN